jgi:hypothetical protein
MDLSGAVAIAVQAEETVIVSDAEDRGGATVVPVRSSPRAAGGRRRVMLGVGLALGGLVAMGAVGGWIVMRPSPSAPLATSSGVGPVGVTPPVAAPPVSEPATAQPSARAAEPEVASVAHVDESPGVTRAPAPPGSSPSASVRTARPGGGSAADALTRAFARREADVGRCFDAQAADLQGAPKLAIRFTVDVEGHVKSAQVLPAEVASTPLGQCLMDVARGTQFGPQTEEVSFRIPIVARRGS